MTETERKPRRRLRLALIVIAAVVLLLVGLTRIAAVEDAIAKNIVEARINGTLTEDVLGDDTLHVMVCGSGSPMPSPERAQACVLVFAGGQGYVFDAGMGSAENLGLWRVPAETIEHVFLTHYHSDHVADLYELNLQGWVTGRGVPLQVHGPPGVQSVVEGFQKTYALDRTYREGHHTAAVMPLERGDLVAVPFEVGTSSKIIYEDGELKVSAFSVEHPPIEPAVGYRVDYRGRSVVISGDPLPTPSLIEAARGADLLLHEALAPHMVKTLEVASDEADQPRVATIMRDIPTYHTSPVQAAEVANEAGVGKLVLYHLAPSPPKFPALAERVFLRGVADVRPGVTLAYDGSTYALPVGEDTIREGKL